jgi:GT2 family glycosyltransferase
MATTPLFSVIIPTCDRPERLATCLEALVALDSSPERFEVVVSDDGSQASLAPILGRFADRIQLQLVAGPNAGPAAARNRGAARAAGRFLLFIDDDCLAEPGWLTAYERSVASAPNRLLAGAIVNGVPENRFATATQLIVSYAYAQNDRRTEGTRFFNACNLAVPAEHFHRIGGFSEVFPLAAGEDYDFCHRWQHAGLGTGFVPDAVVRHRHPLTLGSFCRQHFNYGRGLYRCRRRIARREQASLRFEAPTFYLGLLRFPMQQVEGAAGWLYGLLVVGSQFATLAGAAREWLVTEGPDAR